MKQEQNPQLTNNQLRHALSIGLMLASICIIFSVEQFWQDKNYLALIVCTALQAIITITIRKLIQ